jgi:hypothetical protein
MTRRGKIAMGIAVAAVAGTVAALWIAKRPRPRHVEFLTGVVLRQNADPRKQQPVLGARITASPDLAPGSWESGSSGLFRVSLGTGVDVGQAITLRFRHPDYEPADMTVAASDEIYVVRMTPIPRNADGAPSGPQTPVADIRVRYAVKTVTTANIGSTVKAFEVVNTGNVPCNKRAPCSPDGKWKATIGSAPFDAGEGNEFRNVRVSCIAGPCPFTKVEAQDFSQGGRVIKVSVRNWSDTVTYLFEAEVTQTMASELIRQSYPAIFDQAMNFTLPPGAQGPSIEAEVNGAEIVFPLGPNLNLSWAQCSVKIGQDQTKAYRCELRPGYRFQ